MNFLKYNKIKFSKKRKMKNRSRIIAVALCAAVIFQQAGIGTADAAVTKEQVVNSYTAAANGQAVINNLKYTDMQNAAYDLKDAVYQDGALNLLLGAGNTKFNPNGSVSKEFALYLVYMAANRAQDVDTQGQALNAARTADRRKTNIQAVLNDGSLQLAANEGLISQQELADALQDDQSGLDATAFKRSAPVQRQELATWLAKALMLPPAYQEQEIFNSYFDWSGAKAENVPYIEAVLENNIMSGDGKGSFNPNQAVTRQQAARILKNAENVILPLRNMEKRTATVEDIQSTRDTSRGYRTDYNSYVVRNSDGFLDEIVTESRYQNPTTTSNELTGATQPSYRTEIPLYKNGAITTAQSLKKGDRIEYIVGVGDGVVRYARVLSNSGETSYVAAVVNSANYGARTINVTPLKQKVQYPGQDISNPEKQTYTNGNLVYENYSYSNNLLNAVTKAPLDMTSIQPDSTVILGIRQNIVTEIVPITVKKDREQGLVAGIVEENNPQLGYLTLYNEDGTGKTPLELSGLRTFNYSDPNSVEVYKGHEPAGLEDIEAGDTVFVRIDKNGTVSSISSVSNYTVRYGTVINKKISSISVETNKGAIQYNTDGADVIKDGKLSKLSQLKDGDRVKLLVNEAPNITILKEITIESGDKQVANVYKGSFESYDDNLGQITLKDPWTLRNGKWVKDEAEPFKTVRLSGDFTAYYDGNTRPLRDLNRLMAGLTVYVASIKDYGNGENGVVADFINELDKEVPYNDKVYTAGSNKFVLSQAQTSISYNPGTIVVKDGRLVQGSSVSADDYAYVMANRDNSSGNLVAGVVSLEQRPGTETLQLYRGRITGIDEYNSVTLQSYSRLNGINWDYANTPMTFTLNSNTRITDTDGIVGQGDFTTYNGANTFRDRTVYILSDGTNAVEISTAPYGNVNISGEIATTSGAAIDVGGGVPAEPTAISLRNCRYYNTSTHLWVNMGDSSFNLLVNSLVLKNNQRVSPSTLKKGDKVRVLKKDNAVTGDAYIVIVEQ